MKNIGIGEQAENEDDSFSDESPADSEDSQNQDALGNNSLIYASSESSDISQDSEAAFVPREKMLMFKEAHGAKLRTQKS